MKLLVISNCQGPLLHHAFLRAASRRFASTYEPIGDLQVHKLAADQAGWVESLIEQAEVILTQPIVNAKVESCTLASLRQRQGKRIEVFPALHFDALLPGTVFNTWKAPDFPFQFWEEDVSFAAAYCAGLSPAQTLTAFHDIPVLTPAQIEARVAWSVGQIRQRETEAGVEVPMSDFYADNWRDTALHYEKSHPKTAPYLELCRRFSRRFDLDDLDLNLVRNHPGNCHFGLPVKTWVKQAGQLRFEDDPGVALVDARPIPFQDVITAYLEFYATRGVEAVQAHHADQLYFKMALNTYREAFRPMARLRRAVRSMAGRN
ncbi:WcbI family polysaccharide biosynthesis putative acetyltransferase [Pseudotabrizicola alkalilacus]|uniref:Polysaccharide biosynthesis enzyme WcbI domain-containing protein n=1 Tax=Pseudotabrizicola alkalilacus TaxID=2305252 RepID=A0A411Z760_9RHOB|nr:WcbI family polysaccharide biosynthesis putative acetyltransferase [Pseudotabrizicola alkalilacus]RGP38903.1 hypothetical protein D1012_01945 [Pseudotabrizicola alkalilacus]